MKGLSPPQTVDGAADPDLPPASTLATTISNEAFLLLSLLLTLHALVHGTMSLLWARTRSPCCRCPCTVPPPRVLQHIRGSAEPVADGRGGVVGHAAHPFGPVVHRNGGPLKLARRAKSRTTRPPTRCARRCLQFALLIASAVAYVASAWWIVDVRPFSLSTDLSGCLREAYYYSHTLRRRRRRYRRRFWALRLQPSCF